MVATAILDAGVILDDLLNRLTVTLLDSSSGEIRVKTCLKVFQVGFGPDVSSVCLDLRIEYMNE